MRCSFFPTLQTRLPLTPPRDSQRQMKERRGSHMKAFASTPDDDDVCLLSTQFLVALHPTPLQSAPWRAMLVDTVHSTNEPPSPPSVLPPASPRSNLLLPLHPVPLRPAPQDLVDDPANAPAIWGTTATFAEANKIAKDFGQVCAAMATVS